MPTSVQHLASALVPFLTSAPQTAEQVAHASAQPVPDVQNSLAALVDDHVIVCTAHSGVSTYRKPSPLEEFQRAMEDRPTMERIRVALTFPAAYLVVLGLDLFTRMGIGQLTEISDMARMDSLTNTGGKPLDINRLGRLEDLLQETKRHVLGFSSGASMGIHNPKVNPFVTRAYQVMRAMRHRMAWDENPASGHSTWHQEPSFDGNRPTLALTTTTTAGPMLTLELSEDEARAVEMALHFHAQILNGNFDALLELGRKEVLKTNMGLPLSEKQLVTLASYCRELSATLKPPVLQSPGSGANEVAVSLDALAKSLHSVTAKLSAEEVIQPDTKLEMSVKRSASNEFDVLLVDIPANAMLSYKGGKFRLIGPSTVGKGVAILAETYQIQTAIAKANLMHMRS